MYASNLEINTNKTFDESAYENSCKCNNPVCIHNTTDDERADLLKEYLDSLPVDPFLLPRTEDGKKPLIQKERVALDSSEGQELLVTGEEAVRRIREEDANGFCLYAGKPAHNTEELVFADHDDMDKFSLDTLPETLTVRSGSGEGSHETFINGGYVENAVGKDEYEEAGEIRASNWFVVTPGSIHPSEGIYHTSDIRDLATLSEDNIPRGLQKRSFGNGGSNLDDQPVEESEIQEIKNQVDSDVVDIALEYFNEFKNNGNLSAFYCLHDRLKGGRGDYELTNDAGKIDRDLQEKTILTHLYGVYSSLGYSDDRAKELAYHLLSHYCIESNGGNTKDGKPRKWLKRGTDYRTEQLRYAAIQFDRDEFNKWCNKSTKALTRYKRQNNEYSEVTKGLALFVVDLLSGVYENMAPEEIHKYVLPEYNYSLTIPELEALIAGLKRDHMYNDIPRPSSEEDMGDEDLYPKKKTVKEVCKRVDRVYKGNQKSSFDKCLKRMQRRGEVKIACMEEGVDYRVYPSDLDDPEGADHIKYNGEKLE